MRLSLVDRACTVHTPPPMSVCCGACVCAVHGAQEMQALSDQLARAMIKEGVPPASAPNSSGS
eukprot:COSAG01_NODE_423_length_17260_cov_203.736962_13_plen_63_part_00